MIEFINREYPNLKKFSPTYFYQTYAMDTRKTFNTFFDFDNNENNGENIIKINNKEFNFRKNNQHNYIEQNNNYNSFIPNTINRNILKSKYLNIFENNAYA